MTSNVSTKKSKWKVMWSKLNPKPSALIYYNWRGGSNDCKIEIRPVNVALYFSSYLNIIDRQSDKIIIA